MHNKLHSLDNLYIPEQLDIEKEPIKIPKIFTWESRIRKEHVYFAEEEN